MDEEDFTIERYRVPLESGNYTLSLSQGPFEFANNTPKDVSFLVGGEDLPAILLTEDGKFILSGRESEDPHEIVEAFRRWMKEFTKDRA